MSNSYESDPVKAEARHEIYKATHWLPKEIGEGTALFFPSTNDLEMRLLEKRGFRRERMIGLEGDPEKVRLVRKANPDLLVVPMTTHEFFAGGWQQYKEFFPLTYCGLDYECQLNDSVGMDIENIAFQNLMIDNGLIYTNLVGARENDLKKKTYFQNLLLMCKNEWCIRNLLKKNVNISDIYDKHYSALGIDGDEMEGKDWRLVFENTLRDLTPFINLDNFPLVRSTIFPLVIEEILMMSSQKSFIDGGIRSVKNILRVRNEEFYREQMQKNNSSRKKLKFTSLEELFDRSINSRLHISSLNYGSPEGLAYKTTRKYYSQGDLNLLPILFEVVDAKGYVAKDSRHLEYVSNKKTHMIIDIFSLKKINPDAKCAYDKMLENKMILVRDHSSPYLVKKESVENAPITYEKELRDFLRKESLSAVHWLKKNVGYLSRKEVVNFNPLSVYQRENLGCATTSIERVDTSEESILKKNAEVCSRENLSKPNPQSYPSNNNSNQFFLKLKIYNRLPQAHQKAIKYFAEDISDSLSSQKEETVREAFLSSNFEEYIRVPIEDIRLYAFFDDLRALIRKNKPITSEVVNSCYESVRDAPSLLEIVPFKATRIKNSLPEVPEHIKEEIQQLARDGFTTDEIWEDYKDKGVFESRRQFGSILAWGHDSFKEKRKKQSNNGTENDAAA